MENRLAERFSVQYESALGLRNGQEIPGVLENFSATGVYFRCKSNNGSKQHTFKQGDQSVILLKNPYFPDTPACMIKGANVRTTEGGAGISLNGDAENIAALAVLNILRELQVNTDQSEGDGAA